MSLSKILYGDDYTNKLEEFNKEVERIHEKYKGDFDTTAYFTLHTPDPNGQIILVLDEDKKIPLELREQILNVFNNIWK